MTYTATTRLAVPNPDDNLDRWAKRFRRHLRSAGYADATVEAYVAAVEQLADFLATDSDDDGRAFPTNIESIRETHIDAYLSKRRELGNSKATINQRFRSLQQFFKYVEGQSKKDDPDGLGIIRTPMYGMMPPKLDEKLVPHVHDDTIKLLLNVCKGREFNDIRDAAVIRAFAVTGCRRSEMASMTPATGRLDLDLCWAKVWGKNSVERQVNFDEATADAIDRYLMIRERHPKANTSFIKLDPDSKIEYPALWITRLGPMKSNSFYQMLERRCEQAGIPKIHPHQLRHTFAHNWLADGGNEIDLMRLTGWKSRSMVDRYTKSAGSELAEGAYRRQRPGKRY